MSARVGAALALVALSSALGCREEPTRPPAAVGTVEPPPRPPTLIATWVVPASQRVYERVRIAVAGEAAPFQLPVALSRRFGLPPAVSGRFSTHAPVFGAFGLSDRGSEWAVAFEVQSGKELVAELSTGTNARFQAVASGEVTLLRGGALPLGVVDRRLVVASTEGAVVRHAAHLARGVHWDASANGEAQVAIELAPGSGRLLDALAGAVADATAARFRTWLSAQSALRGAPDLVDPEALSGLASEFEGALRSGLRHISGGGGELRFVEGEARLSGTLRIERAEAPRLDASCEAVRSVRAGMMAALVLPVHRLPASALERVGRALAVPKRASPGAGTPGRVQSGVRPDERGFALRGPALIGLSQFAGERQWFLQGEPRTLDAVTLRAPFDLLAAPALEPHLGSRRFSTPPRASAPAGSFSSSGAEPAWEASWRSEPAVTSWALGVGSSRWLSAPRDESLAQTFETWERLCTGEPLFALGWRHPGGTTEASVSLDQGELSVDARVPLELLFSWLGQPP